MLKVKKITIENFRGIKLPLSLNFVKGANPTSVIIYGRNGTGKSSITEAWEWLNTFRINRLEGKDGVSALDNTHKSSNGINSYVDVEFHNSTINSARVTFNPKKITLPTVTGDYQEFKSKSNYPNYLRYSDLQDFVYKTKTEKYLYIAKYFGLEKFTRNQSDLQTTINKITSVLLTYQKSLNTNIKEINTITTQTDVSEAIIVEFINTVATKHKLSVINEFKDADILKEALEKIVQTNPITKELTEWKGFQTKLNQFHPISSVKDASIELETAFSQLKKDEESIKQLILSSLYELSLEIIPQIEDKTKCPVCDNKFDGDLIKHISEKHSALDTLNKNKKEFEKLKAALEKQFDTLSKKITAIQSENSTIVLKSVKSFFDELISINTSLPSIISTLKKQLKDLSTIDVSNNQAISKIEDIIADEPEIKKAVSTRIKELEADEPSKTLAKDYGNIINIITNYKNYLINTAKVDYITEILGNFNELFNSLTLFIQNKIQTTFTNISGDVIECFNTLENSNAFLKNPEIKLMTGKDKAVELEIEFVTEKISPAYKFLSESQVNSFGLAIFLGAVKHFNNEFKFFVLDDIVNSFDSFKRPKLSQLIANKFNDFQVLMFTHDQIFFDTIQRDFPTWQRYKFTSWDYSTGPRFMLAKNYAEEIQGYLDEDSPITAGQTLGRYLEWTLGVVNENMQTPIRYKIENTYTLGEFYDPFIKRFKDKLKVAGKQHKLIQAFEQFEQGTIFRNYCAHWKNEANGFTTPEIESIFKKWIDIETMIHCDTCKSFVGFSTITNTEYIKCNCGSIDLKQNDFYS